MENKGGAHDNGDRRQRPSHATVGPRQAEGERHSDQKTQPIGSSALASNGSPFKHDRERAKQNDLEADEERHNGKSNIPVPGSEEDVEDKEKAEGGEVHSKSTPHDAPMSHPYVKPSTVYEERLEKR